MSERFNSEFMHDKIECIARLRKVTLFPICGNNSALQLIQFLFLWALRNSSNTKAKAKKYLKKESLFCVYCQQRVRVHNSRNNRWQTWWLKQVAETTSLLISRKTNRKQSEMFETLNSAAPDKHLPTLPKKVQQLRIKYSNT